MNIVFLAINSVALTLITIFGSAICAVVGVLVNRHIANRKPPTDDIISTNQSYWQDETGRLQRETVELRKSLDKAKERERNQEDKLEQLNRDVELMTFKYYQAVVENHGFEKELGKRRN